MLNDILAHISLVFGVVKAWFILLIHCNGGVFGKWLSENVFRLDVRDETLITRDMLCLDILCRPTNPILTLSRRVCELNMVVVQILGRSLRIEGSLSMGDASACCHKCTFRVNCRLRRLIYDNSVSFSGGAPEDFNFLRDVACVTWQVFFLKIDLLFVCHP